MALINALSSPLVSIDPETGVVTLNPPLPGSGGLPPYPGMDPEPLPGYPGDYPGVESPESTGRCCEGKICDCLGGSLTTIARATTSIAITLDKKLGSICDNIDLCIDKIIEKLKYRLEGPLYSCDECKRMIEQGLGGTLEYAIRCSANSLSDCKKEIDCSMSKPESWGKPCKGCGKEPCCCNKGVCEPCGPTEKPQKRYWGWCNPESSVVIVTEEGQTAPGPGFIRASDADTEIAAFEEAESRCGRIAKFPTPGGPQQPVRIVAPLCNLNDYFSGAAMNRIASANGLANVAAGAVQATAAVTRFGFEGINLEKVGDLIVGLFRGITGTPAYMANELSPLVSGALGCNDSQFQQGMLLLNALDMVGKYTGSNYDEWTTHIKYAMHHSCRQRQLDPDKAMAAFLANGLTPSALDTTWGIHGLCPEARSAYTQAAKSKPLPLQLAIMRRRKMIGQSEYRNGMRELGFLEPQVSESLFQLTEQVPTMSDIIRFMVRDADDDQLANQLQLDSFFEQKYGRQLKKWSQDQGIPETVAKYWWRAHWTIPSPGQLFTFYHRLRHNPAFGGPEKLLGDIKAALVQQDILPYWHNHFLATSFHPLTRVDVRRAYRIGVLDLDGVTKAYIDGGYSDENAATLTKFAKQEKEQTAALHKSIRLWVKGAITREQAFQRMRDHGYEAATINQALDDAEIGFKASDPANAFARGDIDRNAFSTALSSLGVSQGGIDKLASLLGLKRTSHYALQDYVAGVSDHAEASQTMMDSGMNPDIVVSLLREADRAITRQFAINCQRGIKRRFLTGELDEQEAEAALVQTGTNQSRATRLVSGWKCEKSSTGKAVAASKLCEWLAVGAITQADFLLRLRKIGYDEPDANLMLSDCLAGISERRRRQAEKEAKEAAALDSKAAAAARRNAATVEREQNKLERMRKQSATTRKTRERQLLSAIEKLHDTCDCGLAIATQTVRDNYSRIEREFGLSKDETLQILIQAADTYTAADIGSYDVAANLLAEAAAAVELET